VEIGYTRPEKLTAYRNAGIADIRWYAKDGTLHGHHHVINKKTVKTKTVEVVERLSPNSMFGLAVVDRGYYCDDCGHEAMLDSAASSYLKEHGMEESDGNFTDLEETYRDDPWKLVEKLTKNHQIEAENEATEASLYATQLYVYGNTEFYIKIGFCDQCGKYELLDKFNASENGPIDTYSEFQKARADYLRELNQLIDHCEHMALREPHKRKWRVDAETWTDAKSLVSFAKLPEIYDSLEIDPTDFDRWEKP
jgi:hypothetical protein